MPTDRLRHLREPIFVVAPVLVGGLLYIGFRDTGLLMFRVADALGLTPMVDQFRAALRPLRPHAPAWTILSLPTGLWALSMMLFVRAIWHGYPLARLWWGGAAAVFAVGSEALQGVGLLPGTFCAVDMVCVLLPAILVVPDIRRLRHTVPFLPLIHSRHERGLS